MEAWAGRSVRLSGRDSGGIAGEGGPGEQCSRKGATPTALHPRVVPYPTCTHNIP